MNKILLFLCFILLSCRGEIKQIECTTPIGELLFSESMIEWGIINMENKYLRKINVYNPTKKDIYFKVLKEHPEITVLRWCGGSLLSAEEVFLLPKHGIDSLFVSFYGRDTSLFGQYHEAIHFETNGEILVTGLQMDGVIIENFNQDSFIAPPCISIERDTFEFNLFQGNNELIKIPVRIKNIGDKELIIRKIESTCGCATPKIENRLIANGQYTTLHIDYQPQAQIGSSVQKIRLITNDPRTPLKMIVIKSHVKSKN